MLHIQKSCVMQKKSHFTHVVISDMGETCMIYQTYPVNELTGTRSIVVSTQPIVPATRPIVTGTRSVVVCTRPVVVDTRPVVAGTDPEFTGFINLVPLC
jgi:hypothetical protein